MTNNMYTALAEVYDDFADDDFAERAKYYAEFLPSRGDGADVGCGTGALTLELYRRGLNVYGVDSSPQMLNRAVARARKAGAEIKFVVGRAEDLPYTHKLDFAVAANDVYNYVPKLLPAFEKAYEALKPNGIFAFDISSEYKLTQILAGNTFSETKDDVTYIWQNFRKGNKLIIDFTVFSPVGKSYIKTCETQTQYIHSLDCVNKALADAGFSGIKAYAFGKKRKPADDTERIMFFARKPIKEK